jgi:hypothetical protein
MHYKLLIFIITFGFIAIIPSKAQNDSIFINFSGSNVDFSQFIETIENKYPIKFYYDPQWVDSIDISGKFENISINQALNQIFLNKGLNFFIDAKGNIVITKSEIQTELKEEWVENYSTNKKILNENNSNSFDKYIDENEKNKIEEIIFGKKNNGGTARISGYIKDKDTGEPIVGAEVLLEGSRLGVYSNAEGYYAINIKCGIYKIGYKAFGMITIYKKVNIYADGELNVNLAKDLIALKEVVITEDKYNNLKNNQIGLEKLSTKEIKELPYAMGEKDILKASLFLPGIQTVGEASTGMNVRGGAADQNLFIMNNVPVFNTSHMLGMFSAFNADLIKDFKLYKSNIPIEFGGRISSVFDITSRQGDKKDFSLKGGISPITGRLLVEGPIIPEKSSYILGIRSTYSNWLLRQLENSDIKNSNIYFDDITVNINHEINENNQVSLFGYFSIDNYTLTSSINYNYSNIGASINWKHIFGKKLFSNTSGAYSNYNFQETNKFFKDYKYVYKHSLKYFEIKQTYNYVPVSNHNITFGFNSILYQMSPGAFNPLDEESNFQGKTFEQEKAMESSIYIGDTYELLKKISVSAGLRYSFYNYLGAKTVFSYQENNPLSNKTVVDTMFYPNFKTIQSYSGLDIRLSLRYLINDNNSLKIGYSRNNQYLFILSNTTSISPTDKWKLCDPFSKPIIGDQYNLGYYNSFNNMKYDVSIELYLKKNINISDYKNGADLVKNEFIERDILTGLNRNYGIEFMIKKNSGKLSGWINYVYSVSEFRFKGNTYEETINKGTFYPSNYDKPHNINLVVNYRNFRRISISANFVYNTGRPYTAPTFQYTLKDHIIINYSDRNQLRIPDYYRVDLSINLDGNLIRKKFAHAFWSVTIYNLTARRNVNSIFYTTQGGKIKSYMVSIYSVPVFSISYNFKLGNYFSK